MTTVPGGLGDLSDPQLGLGPQINILPPKRTFGGRLVFPPVGRAEVQPNTLLLVLAIKNTVNGLSCSDGTMALSQTSPIRIPPHAHFRKSPHARRR
jgi:hypothetical protein